MLAACGGSEPVVVVRQAANNPLRGVKHFKVAPVTWNGLTMEGKPEADWLASRSPEQRVSWENDKVQATPKMLERFRVEKKDDESFEPLVGVPQKGDLVIHVNVDAYVDPFFFTTVEIRDADGQVLDVVRPPKRGGGWGLAMHLNTMRVFVPLDVIQYVRKRAADLPVTEG